MYFSVRIKDARTSIIDYGVDEKFVFKVEDVLHKRNTPKVVRCLEEVAKLVSKQIFIGILIFPVAVEHILIWGVSKFFSKGPK